MSSLIDQVAAAEQGERDSAVGTYLKILARHDRPEPGDGPALRAAMKTLGFSATRLEGDLRVLAEAAKLAQQGTEADSPELQDAIAAAGQALAEHLNATEEARRAAEARRLDLAGQLQALQTRQKQAREARGRLAVLRRQHSALFGEPAPEPQDAPGFQQIVGAWPPAEPSAELAAAQRPIGLAEPQNWR
jgi:hypothetical protein